MVSRQVRRRNVAVSRQLVLSKGEMAMNPSAAESNASELDERGAKRYSTSLPLTIVCGDGSEQAGVGVDISESGIRFQASCMLCVGVPYRIDLGEGMWVEARVVHRLSNGEYGAMFVGTPSDMAKVAAFVRQMPKL